MHLEKEAPTELAFLYPIMGMKWIVSFTYKESLACSVKLLLIASQNTGSDLPSKVL